VTWTKEEELQRKKKKKGEGGGRKKFVRNALSWSPKKHLRRLKKGRKGKKLVTGDIKEELFIQLGEKVIPLLRYLGAHERSGGLSKYEDSNRS